MNRVNNILLELDLYKNNSFLTHNYHPYPAKFIPKIPNEIIIKLSDPGDRILDPFCGSGTALVEAMMLSRRAIGVDINPLACLVSKVKTTIISDSDITGINNIAANMVDEINSDVAYEIPNFYNIDHWFNHQVQKELSVIRYHIRMIEEEILKNFLSVAFSAIITKVSNQESDTRYAAINKHIKKYEVAHYFSQKVADMIIRMLEFRLHAYGKPDVTVYHKDSTVLSFLDGDFSLAVTSPPYMNSYDYYLYHKHRMNWLDMNYKDAQDKEFGSRNKHNDQKLGIEYYNDPILNNAKEVKRLLRKGGYYCVVVGDSVLRGELIKMNKNFDAIFQRIGYKKVREIAFNQRKYTKAFTPNMRNIEKQSYILIYQN